MGRGSRGPDILGQSVFGYILARTRLFQKPLDKGICARFYDAQGRGCLPVHQGSRYGEPGFGSKVLFEHFVQVHPIELIPRYDEIVAGFLRPEMYEILSHGIGGSLVPARVDRGLLGGQNFDEAAGKTIEVIRPGDMEMKAGGIELGENIDFSETCVDAVGDRDIHDAELAAEGYGRL
jgi:hypothetical protein